MCSLCLWRRPMQCLKPSRKPMPLTTSTPTPCLLAWVPPASRPGCARLRLEELTSCDPGNRHPKPTLKGLGFGGLGFRGLQGLGLTTAMGPNIF
ncbi:unnamed protein product [Symbiodinium microadriaticum]|nr:unnamed protein product [Symbiodinium microadriaticum]